MTLFKDSLHSFHQAAALVQVGGPLEELRILANLFAAVGEMLERVAQARQYNGYTRLVKTMIGIQAQLEKAKLCETRSPDQTRNLEQSLKKVSVLILLSNLNRRTKSISITISETSVLESVHTMIWPGCIISSTRSWAAYIGMSDGWRRMDDRCTCHSRIS